MMTAYSPAALAERWDCHPNYVIKLIKQGSLPAFSIGKMWRIKPEDVDAFEDRVGDRPSKEPCVVYVIRCGNFIKIGKAADPAKRIAQLDAANPLELERIAVIKGQDGHRLERELHQQFHEQRHKGEWFRLEGALAEWVAGLRSAL